ncbi:MAG: methionine biosynthesis protein MetW [Candidatus Omnitrophota bacterium]|jgi:methionine biosynthesis protein MetW
MITENKEIRVDFEAIRDIIPLNASVLDLGCGNGELLFLLAGEKKVRGQGIEIDEQAIYDCVAKGLNVFHGDIDSGLVEYQDKSFDFVILNQSLQQVKHFEPVLTDALRVGKKVVVGFPNFAHYKSRVQLFFRGRAPVTGSLPYTWYESPNVHFLSITDFTGYCRRKRIRIEAGVFIGEKSVVRLFPNIFAQTGIFLISDGFHPLGQAERERDAEV